MAAGRLPARTRGSAALHACSQSIHEISRRVEAQSAEEARALFAAGEGHRCHLGDCLHVEMDQLYDDAA